MLRHAQPEQAAHQAAEPDSIAPSASSGQALRAGQSAALRIAITTLGCKVNQYDSATIEDRLKADGHILVPFSETADVDIVNSCTVTNQADAESRQLARRAKRDNT